MAQASAAASSGRNDPAGTKLPEIARDYNFAADILQSNLAAGRANKPAFIDANGSWTYGQLADRAARFGAMLRAKGIRREERILICLLDTIDWPTAFLGALKAGVVAIPVNTLMTESDYEFMLSDSRARMLVVSEALYPKFAELIARKSDLAPDLAHVVVSGTNAHGHDHFETLIAASRAGRLHGADHARRHRLLALHLGFDRQAEGRRACACEPETHQRSLCRTDPWPSRG